MEVHRYCPGYLYPMSKPHHIFDRRIFWDVDFDKLVYEADAAFTLRPTFG